MKTEFTKSGTFERPGLIGRTIRLGAGIMLLFLFILIIVGYKPGAAAGPSNLLWWFGGLLALYGLPDMVNGVLGRDWGRRPQVVVLVVALGAGILDLIRYGSFFGPVLTLVAFLLLIYVTGVGGLSSLLASVLAVPG